MDIVFPFGFPAATAFYLVLLVATLTVHVLFMNYVLAGAAYLLWYRVFGGNSPLELPFDDDDFAAGLPYLHPAERYSPTIGGTLCDWLPAMLSGAITAGVAPLLFLQILYQREFYTANLLLFSRWMAILPVLIVGFYSLYLVRGDWFCRQVILVRGVLACVPLACVAFVAYSWTENHLLSLQSAGTWRSFYVEQPRFYYEPQLVPRLLVWAFGSLPTMATWLGWQLFYRQQHLHDVAGSEAKRVANLALVGIVLAVLAAVWYYRVIDATTREVFFTPAALPYLAVATGGLVISALAWLWQRTRDDFDTSALSVATTGMIGTLLGMTICREVVRLAALGPQRLAELHPRHVDATHVSGFGAFLLFAVINGSLIAMCFWLVRRGRRYHG